MSKVCFFMSMSLDGFVAGPHDEIEPLHDWLFATSPHEPGKWAKTAGEPEKFFGPEGVNKELLDSLIAIDGATIVGRRTYDISNGWGGKPPGRGRYFVITHNPPPADEISKNYTFLTDGIENAVRDARIASKSGIVELMGANVIQQGLAAGLVDEIIIVLIPVLMGEGIRLFEHLGSEHVTLKRTRVTEGPGGVTHLFFDVVR